MEYNHCVLFVILCIASAVLCESRENGQERTNGTFIQQLAWRMSADVGYVIEDVKVLIMMQEKQQEEMKKQLNETQLMKEEMKKQHDEQRQLMKEEMKKQHDEQPQLMKEEMKKQHDEQRQLMKEEMKKQLNETQLMKEEMKKQHDEQRQLMKEEMKKQHDEQQLLLQQLDNIFYGKDNIVILRRIDNKYNFDTQLWANYIVGFGDRNGSFWLGLEQIHRLTSRWNYALRIDLTDWDDTTAWARYDQVYIAGEDNCYMLRVGNYSGTAGDSLAYHNGMLFSTRDMDNGKYPGKCAFDNQGGWWYRGCNYSHLTAPYRSEDERTTTPGMRWRHWKGYHYSYKRAEMTLVLR